MNSRATIVCCTMIWLLALAAHAAPPTLKRLEPWGARRGQTAKLTFVGSGLEPGAELFAALPGKIQERPGGNSQRLKFELTLPPDAQVGVYPIRVRTAAGLSNQLLFSVGDLPEVVEQEPNDALPFPSQFGADDGQSGQASLSRQTVVLPTTVSGAATGTDRDVFCIPGEAGQRLVVEVEARRLGSKLDPTVHLYTAEGKELAYSDDTPGLGGDCRLVATLPAAGDYFVAVRDAKYAGASPAFYRMKIGSFAYAEGIFPLGWQRDREVDVTLLGGTYASPAQTHVVTATSDRRGQIFVPPSLRSPQALLPFRFALGSGPELLEPEQTGARWFKDAQVMNGLIAEAGEVDRYNFPVRPGQVWVFDLDAASLGSRLDGFLTVFDPSGKQLASVDDTDGLDPRLRFTVPEGLDHVVLRVEDLHRRGGPTYGYRLKAHPARTGFSLRVVPDVVNVPRRGTAVVQVRAVRSGYKGPIQLTIPEGLRDIRAEGGRIAPGSNQGYLVLSATPQAQLRAFDLAVSGYGGPVAKPINRPAVSGNRSRYAMTNPLAARVPTAVCQAPPVLFSLSGRSVRVLHGFPGELKITARRGPKAAEAIAITGTGIRPQDVRGASGTIAKGSNEATLKLEANVRDEPLGKFTLLLEAKSKVGGREELIRLPPVQVEVARPFTLELVDKNINISLGSRGPLAAIVQRLAPFDGAVKVRPAGTLPVGLALTPVEVPKGQSLALMELRTEENAVPGEFDLQLQGAIEMPGPKRGKEYTVPPVTVQVKIVAAATDQKAAGS